MCNVMYSSLHTEHFHCPKTPLGSPCLVFSDLLGLVIWFCNQFSKALIYYYFKYFFCSFILPFPSGTPIMYILISSTVLRCSALLLFLFFLFRFQSGKYLLTCLQAEWSFSLTVSSLLAFFISVIVIFISTISYWFFEFSPLCLNYSSILPHCLLF